MDLTCRCSNKYYCPGYDHCAHLCARVKQANWQFTESMHGEHKPHIIDEIAAALVTRVNVPQHEKHKTHLVPKSHTPKHDRK
jgi:hypothetical protein